MSEKISNELSQGAGNLGLFVKVNKTFLNFSDHIRDSRHRRHSQPGDSDNQKPLRHTHLTSTMDTISSDGEDCCASPSPSVVQPDEDLCLDSGCLTTVMIRNVPRWYSQDQLIMLLRELGVRFNFFYCPTDIRHRCNLGYFFVNLVSPVMASVFMRTLDGSNWPDPTNRKLCSATWARIQGYEANARHYLGTPIMNMSFPFRPRIFSEDGTVLLGEPPLPPKPHVFDNEVVVPNRKLFVGGLPTYVAPRTIKNHLEQFGEIEEVAIIFDSVTRLSRGFCFVTFVDASSAGRCLANKEAHFLQGRPLGIRPYNIDPDSAK